MRLFLKERLVGLKNLGRNGFPLGLRLGPLDVDAGEPGAIRRRQELRDDVPLGSSLGRRNLLGGGVAPRRDDEDVAAAGDTGPTAEFVGCPSDCDRPASQHGKR